MPIPWCNAGDLGSIPGLGRSSGEGNGDPLQYSCLENSMDRGAWWAIVHGVTKSRTWLTNAHTSPWKGIIGRISLEWLMLKLKLQYFGPLMQRRISLEKTLMLGKIEGGRRRGWQRMRWLDGIIDSMDMSFHKLSVIVKDREARSATVHGDRKELDMIEQLNSSNC